MITAPSINDYCTLYQWLLHPLSMITASSINDYCTLYQWLLHPLSMITAPSIDNHFVAIVGSRNITTGLFRLAYQKQITSQLQNKMNCELMLTYDTPALWQTGSRNLMGQKTLPTIWGTYMKLVTKYQISAVNSCCPRVFKLGFLPLITSLTPRYQSLSV